MLSLLEGEWPGVAQGIPLPCNDPNSTTMMMTMTWLRYNNKTWWCRCIVPGVVS